MLGYDVEEGRTESGLSLPLPWSERQSGQWILLGTVGVDNFRNTPLPLDLAFNFFFFFFFFLV